MRHLRLVPLVWSLTLWGLSAQLGLEEIVKRSVAASEFDWKEAPRYSYIERDVKTKSGSRSVRTYEVLMIEGSPYNRLTAVDDVPLSAQRRTEELDKLQQEIARRRRESSSSRQKRLDGYERERQQDHALMREMVNAFDFKLLGKDNLDGHEVYVLEATPRPDYQPKSRETKVLTGMKGKLWIDTKDCQWVKVEAEVFKPVPFGLFIAKVHPGTSFLLEQAPVADKLWLPKHFSMSVRSSILWWQRISVEDETYKDYKLMEEQKISWAPTTRNQRILRP
jgi:hypothetical protein